MGDGAFNDGRWFDEMEGYVRDKMSPHRAALEIVHVHGEKVDGISAGSDPANVAHRIYKKYMETDRLKKPPALD